MLSLLPVKQKKSEKLDCKNTSGYRQGLHMKRHCTWWSVRQLRGVYGLGDAARVFESQRLRKLSFPPDARMVPSGDLQKWQRMDIPISELGQSFVLGIQPPKALTMLDRRPPAHDLEGSRGGADGYVHRDGRWWNPLTQMTVHGGSMPVKPRARYVRSLIGPLKRKKIGIRRSHKSYYK